MHRLSGQAIAVPFNRTNCRSRRPAISRAPVTGDFCRTRGGLCVRPDGAIAHPRPPWRAGFVSSGQRQGAVCIAPIGGVLDWGDVRGRGPPLRHGECVLTASQALPTAWWCRQNPVGCREGLALEAARCRGWRWKSGRVRREPPCCTEFGGQPWSRSQTRCSGPDPRGRTPYKVVRQGRAQQRQAGFVSRANDLPLAPHCHPWRRRQLANRAPAG